MSDHTLIGIESPGVNVAVIKKDDDGWKFLILRRSKDESYGGCWGFMTGGKRGEETVAQVAQRELAEETGLKATSFWATEYVVQFYEPEVDKIWLLPLVVAVVPADAEVVLSSENSDFKWLPAKRARLSVSWKNLVWAIDNLADELEIYPARNWVKIKP